MLLKPASPGTGVIAGGPVRAVLECAGIHDVLSKSLGSSNAINIVHATVAALKQLNRPEEIAAKRGLPIEDVAPAACCGPVRPAASLGGGRVMTHLKITQVKSQIGGKQYQRDTLRTLGLQADRPERRPRGPARGARMIQTVRHLVTVEEVD